MAVLTEYVFVVWGNYANAQPFPTTQKVIYYFLWLRTALSHLQESMQDGAQDLSRKQSAERLVP